MTDVFPDDDADRAREPEAGTALCLSGGGFRAMLFHLGGLWRLNELGILPELSRVSSVSGGSIAAGVLAVAWPGLAFGPDGVSPVFESLVVAPLRRLASRTLDVSSVLKGIFLVGTAAEHVASSYDDALFKGATLADLPDEPTFVFHATNVASGALFRFTKAYARDWRVGKIERPTFPLATVVAASSAFPPVLSPLRLRVPAGAWSSAAEGEDLATDAFRRELFLSDGGVYDNLGLETAWKRYRTVLVSDGGKKMAPEGEPKKDWVRHAFRVLSLIDNQVRSLRVRALVDSYVKKEREGAYWGIRTDLAEYGLPDGLPCPHPKTLALAEIPTRLASLAPIDQERLVNWGYAAADAAMRSRGGRAAAAPKAFPYPAAGIG